MPKREQGINIDRYMVIPRCLILISRKDEVLLLKGAPNKRIWADKYNGFGGHIERGEDPLTAAKRELKEESGLEGVDLWLCGISIVDVEDQVGIGMYFFKGEYQDQPLQSSQEGSLEWLRIDEIQEFPLVEDLYTVLPRLIKLKRGEDPLCMRYYYNSSGQIQVDIAS